MRIENWKGYDIRFVEKKPGEWWAVAADVTAALGIKNTSQAVNGNPKRNIKGLPEHMKGICKLYTPGGEQDTLVISEKGIYRLIMLLQPTLYDPKQPDNNVPIPPKVMSESNRPMTTAGTHQTSKTGCVHASGKTGRKRPVVGSEENKLYRA